MVSSNRRTFIILVSHKKFANDIVRTELSNSIIYIFTLSILILKSPIQGIAGPPCDLVPGDEVVNNRNIPRLQHTNCQKANGLYLIPVCGVMRW